eukprot:GHVU01219568.1.p3 GENE.GHVU01219568.1~~GHVU01219568.1.p3  ORF type:complete len:109 (+),score=8.70 GHVU01219568.1:965-1291(+)
MQEANCKTIVFSSSCTVYGRSDAKLTEANCLCPVNPYGHSKRMFEQILLDTHQADPSWKVSILRSPSVAVVAGSRRCGVLLVRACPHAPGIHIYIDYDCYCDYHFKWI